MLLLLLLNFYLTENTGDKNDLKDGDNPRILIITELLNSEGVKSPLKEEIINNVKSNKEKERLVGKSNDSFYGITFRKIKPENKILVSLTFDEVKLVSLSDCLRYFVLDEVYFKNKLNIGNYAREALNKAFKESLVSGKVKYDVNRSVIKDNIILGLTIAKKNNMESQISVSGDKEIFFDCYRFLIHNEAANLIRDKKFDEALKLLQHLTESKLENHNTWFGMGKCFSGTGDKKSALKALESSYNLAILKKPVLKSQWFYNLGVETFNLGDEANLLTEKALKKSIQLFFDENNSLKFLKIP